MVLTGKCKEDFKQWINKRYPNCKIYKLNLDYETKDAYDFFTRKIQPKELLNEMILVFFEQLKDFSFDINKNITQEWITGSDRNSEAIIKTIEKANEIYNETNK